MAFHAGNPSSNLGGDAPEPLESIGPFKGFTYSVDPTPARGHAWVTEAGAL